MTRTSQQLLTDALAILQGLQLPRAQQNERSALCLLALLDLKPGSQWGSAQSPLMGITPIMDWSREHHGKEYAPNTRETFRRQTMHQFVSAGIALYNPDDPSRPVNSPNAVYQISPEALAAVRTFGTAAWDTALRTFIADVGSLTTRYAAPRNMALVPVTIANGTTIALSPGAHSQLIADIVHQFAPRFLPGAELIYVGDTGDKTGYFAKQRLADLGVAVDDHGKFPDVVFYFTAKKWLILVESVTSHGPVDGKRHIELAALFSGFKTGLVYVTAFPSRKAMAKYLADISWETEVWCAEAPTHLIHFNGERFLGPYDTRPGA